MFIIKFPLKWGNLIVNNLFWHFWSTLAKDIASCLKNDCALLFYSPSSYFPNSLRSIFGTYLRCTYVGLKTTLFWRKTTKSVFCSARRLPEDCLPTAWWMPDKCLWHLGWIILENRDMTRGHIHRVPCKASTCSWNLSRFTGPKLSRQ